MNSDISSTSSKAGASLARKHLVLIVDDVPENLQVLAGHLTELGYEILAASNGPRALALARNRKPDLILLDIMMPGVDGFSVCQDLKSDAELSDIPVIFITARTETDDIVKGLQLGAVDYVTKPFKPAELLARVRAHLELKTTRDMLLTYNKQLQRIGDHLRRMNDDKNRFLSIVSHDIRGAFGNVVSVSRLLTDGTEVQGEEATDLLRDIGVEAEHMITLAQNLLNIDAVERNELKLKTESVICSLLLDFAFQTHQMAAQAKNLNVLVTPDDSIIAGDGTACRQILSNLISNAVKYSRTGGSVWIESKKQPDGFVKLSVMDEGPGLSAEDQKKLFLPFTRLSSKVSATEHSVGLGLSIVKLMAETMGGRVLCESALGQGATFSVFLPSA